METADVPPSSGAGRSASLERNFLHEVADDIRAHGVIGSAMNAVKENPLLLLPGGSLLTLAHRGLQRCNRGAGTSGAEPGSFPPQVLARDGAPPYCGDTGNFSLLSALRSDAQQEVEIDGKPPAVPPWALKDPELLVETVATGLEVPEAVVAALASRNEIDHSDWESRLGTSVRKWLNAAYLGMSRDANPDLEIFRLLTLLSRLRSVGCATMVQQVASEAEEELSSLLFNRELAPAATPLLRELHVPAALQEKNALAGEGTASTRAICSDDPRLDLLA